VQISWLTKIPQLPYGNWTKFITSFICSFQE
jgi:hypothetical protein